MRTYNLFISHSCTYTDIWIDNEAYEHLVDFLDKDSSFSYCNYFVPKDDSVHTHGTDQQLYNTIKDQISPCDVVLIMVGVDIPYNKWVGKEIDIAKNEFNPAKPILAIDPWWGKHTSSRIKDTADKIVKWNTESIVSAIREFA
jgi:hypothetical protein